MHLVACEPTGIEFAREPIDATSDRFRRFSVKLIILARTNNIQEKASMQLRHNVILHVAPVTIGTTRHATCTNMSCGLLKIAVHIDFMSRSQ